MTRDINGASLQPGVNVDPVDVWAELRDIVLDRVRQERIRQREKYGDNLENPDGTGPNTTWLEPFTYEGAACIESGFRSSYEDWESEPENGPVTWVHLVREEVAEAFQESDPERLAEELVQVAALCVSWVENLTLRQQGDTPLHRLTTYDPSQAQPGDHQLPHALEDI